MIPPALIWLHRLRRHGGRMLLIIALLALVESWSYLPGAVMSGQRDLFAVGHELIPLGQAALHMLLFAGFALCVRRDLPAGGIGLVILAGLIVQKMEWIDGRLFNLLMNWGLYPSPNPQWIKLTGLTAALVMLGVLVLRRPTRSLDRLFMTVIITMNLLLVALFHLVLVEGGLRAANRRSVDVMRAVIQTPEPVFSDLCSRLDLECYGWLDGSPPPALPPDEALRLFPLLRDTVGRAEVEHSWLFSRDFSITNHIQAYYRRDLGSNRLIIDDGPISRDARRFQAWFYTLQLAAAYGWLGGGLLLLALHKRLLGRRSVRA